jgi:hypothetical protein
MNKQNILTVLLFTVSFVLILVILAWLRFHNKANNYASNFSNAKMLKIYFPSKFDNYDLTNLSLDQLKTDNTNPLTKLLALISSSKIVGKVGNYQGVKEISFGKEYYIPVDGALPSKGKIGMEEVGDVIIITTYILDAPISDINSFIAQVIQIHPWEHPAIEYYDHVGLWMPN